MTALNKSDLSNPKLFALNEQRSYLSLTKEAARLIAKKLDEETSNIYKQNEKLIQRQSLADPVESAANRSKLR